MTPRRGSVSRAPWPGREPRPRRRRLAASRSRSNIVDAEGAAGIVVVDSFVVRYRQAIARPGGASNRQATFSKAPVLGSFVGSLRTRRTDGDSSGVGGSPVARHNAGPTALASLPASRRQVIQSVTFRPYEPGWSDVRMLTIFLKRIVFAI